MKNSHFAGVPSTYRELIAMLPPRQIHTAAEYEAAAKIVEKMIGHSLSADQEDYMDLLATLMEQYESRHEKFRFNRMTPIEALEYILEESGMTASDLGRLLGNRELGSKILRGERGLSMTHIGLLAEHFHVSRELFMPALPGPKKKKNGNSKPAWRGGKLPAFRGKHD